ncbi:nicotinate-nucleotide adenylyltransferase [Leeia sp. TBRC 13508]|uniref:Probable nicotinate-nucleotide adenylyltransferase n=1 Tax=Leeia speluncae TaxID=2884804 RepID=A0ABS8D6Q9_9NEIS|nr:nicotinate-nucleotide adenylyltransferase [Leeia speluncae]MCB6183885.1 nicotinate-nucleotide adenylyltransferase [Leeia speluncae]
MPVTGVFGGTFDPMHLAHLRIVRALRDELQLHEAEDCIRVIPTGFPPHRAQAVASNEQRLEMCRLTIGNEPGLLLDDRELRRDRFCYTVETLAELRGELGASAPIVFLMGADSLTHFHTWHDWRHILDLAHLAVAARPGSDLTHGLNPTVAHLLSENATSPSRPTLSHGKIYVLSTPPEDVSATELRSRLRSEQGTEGLLAEPVRRFILDNRLYR